jgi:hypothetical protein
VTYEARPVRVTAYRVVAVLSQDGTGTLLKLDNGSMVIATPQMTARMKPASGDYWVVQEDGYVYLNPAAVFERKYRPSTWPSPARDSFTVHMNMGNHWKVVDAEIRREDIERGAPWILRAYAEPAVHALVQSFEDVWAEQQDVRHAQPTAG